MADDPNKQTDPNAPPTPTPGADPAAGGGPPAPEPQPAGVMVQLTAEQLAAVQRGEALVLGDDQFKGSVKDRLNSYAAANRDLQAKLKAHEDAKAEETRKQLEAQGEYKTLLETERGQTASLQSQLNEERIRNRFAAAASKANVVDVDAAFLLAKSSPSFAEIKLDADGSVAGLDTVIETLVKDRPYLVSTQPRSQPVGSPSSPGSTTPPPPAAPANAREAEAQFRAGMKGILT